jgi:hypothetical protein
MGREGLEFDEEIEIERKGPHHLGGESTCALNKFSEELFCCILLLSACQLRLLSVIIVL